MRVKQISGFWLKVYFLKSNLLTVANAFGGSKNDKECKTWTNIRCPYQQRLERRPPDWRSSIPSGIMWNLVTNQTKLGFPPAPKPRHAVRPAPRGDRPRGALNRTTLWNPFWNQISAAALHNFCSEGPPSRTVSRDHKQLVLRDTSTTNGLRRNDFWGFPVGLLHAQREKTWQKASSAIAGKKNPGPNNAFLCFVPAGALCIKHFYDLGFHTLSSENINRKRWRMFSKRSPTLSRQRHDEKVCNTNEDKTLFCTIIYLA